jgi:hypothetical protein
MKRSLVWTSLVLITVVIFGFGTAESPLDQSPFPCNESEIPRYKAFHTRQQPVIDGKLDETVWRNAIKSTPFRDLIRGTVMPLDTRVAVMWDEQFLYVGYWVEEPNVAATLKYRDAPVYQDNDVELFIAGSDGYYEFEINAYATIYEVLFFWEREFSRNGYAQLPEFDRNAPGARAFNGVGFKEHPRGTRIGFWNWDFPGLKSAVHIDGTLNDSSDTDGGWTVELALPWKGLEILAKGDGRSVPPKTGDSWRMDFSRFNTLKTSSDDSGGWAWSPHGVWDSHVPECFTIIQFIE